MLCQNCGKNEANVHYTQITNGEKKEFSLCSECAMKLGLTEQMDITDPLLNLRSFIGDFFNDFPEKDRLQKLSGTKQLQCKTCGTTYEEFINDGNFGCEDCYQTFKEPIDRLLKKLHGTSTHLGRKPGVEAKPIVDKVSTKDEKGKVGKENKKADSKKEESKEEKIARLERELDKAIKDERYEDAAKIRDELKEMN